LKGGFSHDGCFATIQYVIEDDNAHFQIDLTEQKANDHAEYLKSL